MEILQKNGCMPDHLCPLCYEPLNNGKPHGSWCK